MYLYAFVAFGEFVALLIGLLLGFPDFLGLPAGSEPGTCWWITTWALR